jgi:hypothetical protein
MNGKWNTGNLRNVGTWDSGGVANMIILEIISENRVETRGMDSSDSG